MDTSIIDRVAAALIPTEYDRAMTITRARDDYDFALAEADRTKAVLQDAIQRLDKAPNILALTEYIVATREYGQALIYLADDETALHLATMTPDMAVKLREHIEVAETFEG